jgi:hypothetical protein
MTADTTTVTTNRLRPRPKVTRPRSCHRRPRQPPSARRRPSFPMASRPRAARWRGRRMTAKKTPALHGARLPLDSQFRCSSAATAAFAAATMGWAWVDMHRSAPAAVSTPGTHPVNASDELPKVTGTPDVAAINSGPSTFVMPTATAEHLVQPAPPEPELTADERYLNLLQGHACNIYDPAKVIAAGRIACQNLALTHDLLTTERWLHSNFGGSEDQAHWVTIDASVIYYPNTPY